MVKLIAVGLYYLNFFKCISCHVDDLKYLRDLLERFEDPRLVPNWSNQGMIFLDYMDISKKV